MMCYRDRWFCPFWEECKKGTDCVRALTDKVQQQANTAGLPIDQPVDQPKCFETNDHS